MSIPQHVAAVLKKSVTLEVESLDRMYLNGYVPGLQAEAGVATGAFLSTPLTPRRSEAEPR